MTKPAVGLQMLVKARNMILTDFLLVLLNLTAQTHSVLRNSLIIFLQRFQRTSGGTQYHFAELQQFCLSFIGENYILLNKLACAFSQCFTMVTDTFDIRAGVQKTGVA